MELKNIEIVKPNNNYNNYIPKDESKIVGNLWKNNFHYRNFN